MEINGWDVTSKITSTLDSIAESHLMTLNAEPMLAEVGEKVRELTGTLHEKIMNQEFQWSLMMTPIKLVNQLRDMCDNEINRREEEFKAIKEEKEQAK